LELKLHLETQNVLRVQPSAVESPSMRMTEPILNDARQLMATYRVPQSCVDFLEQSIVMTQPKVLFTLVLFQFQLRWLLKEKTLRYLVLLL
jgi:hypothetical protein